MNAGRRVAAVIWMSLVFVACGADLDPKANEKPDPFSIGSVPKVRTPKPGAKHPKHTSPAPGQVAIKNKNKPRKTKPKPKPKPINWDIPVGHWIVDTYLLADTFIKNSESVKALPEEVRVKLIENMRAADFSFDLEDDGKWHSHKRYPHGMTESARGTWKQDKDVIIFKQTKKNGKDVKLGFRAKFDKEHILWAEGGVKYRLYRKQ